MRFHRRHMGLPDLIEIVPPPRRVRVTVTVPGSKSVTNRALVLAALADGTTRLRGALWSEDTQVMVDALRALGFDIAVLPDPREPSNRTISVRGHGGTIPRAGTTRQPLDLYVGNAGTAARFLAAIVCLGHGVYRVHGTARMHERPQADVFDSLRALGYHVESPNGRLPALFHGSGPQSGRCQARIDESSQFASALLLGAAVGKWHVEVVGRNAEESAYVEMTRRMAACFPARGGEFDIEPDASSGSYFQAAGWLWGVASAEPGDAVAGVSRVWRVAEEATRLVTVADWPATDWQIDARFPGYLPLPRTISREHDLGDSIMTAVIVAADQAGGRVWRPDPDKPRWLVAREVADEPILFTDLARLRVQECERVVALRQELAKCGADIVESGDTLLVRPSALRGAEIDSRNDHRLAMCFAILGLKVPGMKINNPACVKKTFPDFFVKLVQPPPAGLGVAVRDVRLRRRLGPEELIAD